MTKPPSLPEPLVPAEVDLRDFGFMPLDVLRLRDSDLAIESSAEVFRASVLLWCASWHQVPAGSLPNKDKTLADYSRSGARWPRIRAEVLSRWVECSDGRIYNRVVAEKALEAKAAKDAQRSRTKAATDAKAAKARALQGPRDDHRDDAGNEARNDQRNDQRNGDRNDLQGKGEEGKGEEGRGRNTEPAAQVAARPSDEPPQLSLVDRLKGPPDCPHQAVLALWAEVLPQLPQHDPAQWRGSRADHLRARWRETAAAKRWADQEQGLAYLRKLFGYVGTSPFLTGREHGHGKRPFFAELAWLVEPLNWAKTIEGKYHPMEATA